MLVYLLYRVFAIYAFSTFHMVIAYDQMFLIIISVIVIRHMIVLSISSDFFILLSDAVDIYA